jgi:hypothetical protein
MMMLNEGWGRRPWLSGTVVGVFVLGSAIARAGIGGGDFAARLQGVGAGDLDVLGVVEGADPSTSTVEVSGQTIRLSANTRLTSEAGGSLAKGALVAVYGTIGSDGTVAASQISVLAREYVPGSTTLYVRGMVKSVNAAFATAKVGNLSVDYSSSLYSGSSTISTGSIVEFSGLQTSSSTLYASKAQSLGIGGGDLKAQARGIGGGDLRAQSLGIGGGDLKAQARGIGGGDLKAQSLGIGGGDLKAQARGIGGGDLKAQSLGIGGGDLKAQARGIGAGDLRAQSLGIGGGDLKAQARGIGGGDLRAQSLGIGGGDKR